MYEKLIKVLQQVLLAHIKVVTVVKIVFFNDSAGLPYIRLSKLINLNQHSTYIKESIGTKKDCR